MKLFFIALLVLLLQLPLSLINDLACGTQPQPRGSPCSRLCSKPSKTGPGLYARRGGGRRLPHGGAGAEAQHVGVKHYVFAAFFLFETLAELRLHAVHYEVGWGGHEPVLSRTAGAGRSAATRPGLYGAAVASSLLIVFYSISIQKLRSRRHDCRAAGGRGAEICVVLRMENYALLRRRPASLFTVLAAVMFFTRNVGLVCAGIGREAQS